MQQEIIARELSEDELLSAVREARLNFTRGNDLIIFVNELVNRGVYPARSVLGVPASEMARYWGESWHSWSEPLTCAWCGADLRDVRAGTPFKMTYTKSNVEHCSRCNSKICAQ